jgi:D-alanyl-D-alanine carboxypeptidase (penicillin-binding protein 5/6)
MRSLFKTFAVFLLLCGAANHPARAQSADAFLVLDSTSGRVLDSLNPTKKVQVGSLTKIATAMVVLDWAELSKANLGQEATISAAGAANSGVNPVGFQSGDRVSLRDLLYAALLQSDNIAAQTLAETVGGQLPNGNSPPLARFVAQMNALARTQHMDRTQFLNPHGLENERKLPFSTAADMARLARYAMSKSAFRFYVSQKQRQITVVHADGAQSRYSLQNTNELLGLNGVDGVKTGLTRRAGECVIISAARAPETHQEGEQFFITPRRLIVVVLGSTDRFVAASQLLESGWQKFDMWVAAGRPEEKGQNL